MLALLADADSDDALRLPSLLDEATELCDPLVLLMLPPLLLLLPVAADVEVDVLALAKDTEVVADDGAGREEISIVIGLGPACAAVMDP